jgi:subtilisin family serine protease
MASPHISGLAALAYAEGATTPAELRAALDRAARPIAGLTPDMEGHGMVLAGNLGGKGLPRQAGEPQFALASER